MGQGVGAGYHPAGALGRPLPIEAPRRRTGRRFAHPLIPDDVLSACGERPERHLRAQAGRGRLPSRGDLAVEIVRGSAERSHTTIETDADTLATLVYDGRELAEAMCSGDVKIVRATSRRWSASLRSSPFPSRPHPLPARSTARPARVASSRRSACLGGRRSTAQKPIGKGCRASRLRQLSGKRRAG
jgi:hypothetical protein